MVVNINPYKNISSLKPCPALLERSFAPEQCSPPLGMFSHVTQRALVPSARNPMLLRSNRPKRALYGDSCLKSRMFCVSRSLQKWYLQVRAKRCLLSEYQSRQGRSRPWCPTRVLSCQIFHADKNLAEQKSGRRRTKPGEWSTFCRPPACAAALTQQVKLSLGSTQARCTILKTVVKCRRRWSGVGVNCRAVYQSFCFQGGVEYEVWPGKKCPL